MTDFSTVMQSAVVEWGGIEIEVVFDPTTVLSVENFDTAAFITYKSAEDLLGWRQYSASEKLASKSLRASLGADPQPRKSLVVDSRNKPTEMGLIPMEVFHRIVQWQGFDRGNKSAQAMLAAGYRDSVRSIALGQIVGRVPSVEERNRQIQADRDRFYREYAAGLTDEEWLRGSAAGQTFLSSLSPESLAHQILFGSGWTAPAFLVQAVLNGQDPVEVLERMRLEYEG